MANNKLVLNHMILYSKGWYHRSENMWEDYRRCIQCDGHYTPYSRKDVATLMLMFISKHVDKISYMGLNNHPEERMIRVYELIRNKMDLLLFYENRNNPGKELNPFVLYDDATILACHGILQSIEIKDFDEVLRPSANVLPLRKQRNKTKAQLMQDINERFRGCKSYESDPFYAHWFQRYVTKKSLGEDIANGKLTYKNQHKNDNCRTNCH